MNVNDVMTAAGGVRSRRAGLNLMKSSRHGFDV